MRFLRRAQWVPEPEPLPKPRLEPPQRQRVALVSSAARTRDWYARRKEGKRVYRLALDEGATVDLLTHASLLQVVDGDDHRKVEAALARLIAVMIEDDSRG
jgi:hypothetical protein